jgi:hypothetical protein
MDMYKNKKSSYRSRASTSNPRNGASYDTHKNQNKYNDIYHKVSTFANTLTKNINEIS